jgi:hypothetical protein
MDALPFHRRETPTLVRCEFAFRNKRIALSPVAIGTCGEEIFHAIRTAPIDRHDVVDFERALLGSPSTVGATKPVPRQNRESHLPAERSPSQRKTQHIAKVGRALTGGIVVIVRAR